MGAFVSPTLTCPWFPEFGIDVEAVELAQSGLGAMKKSHTTPLYKKRKCARMSFRFHARNKEGGVGGVWGGCPKYDGFGREYAGGRYRYHRGLSVIRIEMETGR